MNVVTFNDPIKRMLGDYPFKEYLRPFNGWQTAPLFDYATTFEHEKEKIDVMRSTEGMKIAEMQWPFELFRLALVETAVPWQDELLGHIGKGRYVSHYVVARQNLSLIIFCHIKEMWDHDPRYKGLDDPMSFLITDIIRESAEEFRFGFSLNVRGEWVEVTPMLQQAGQTLVGSAVTALVTFLFDAMAPTSHVAVVTPNQPHRSVEWIRQRTHYTLIAHGHPANSAERKLGERISSNGTEELKRLAHARRAHYRVLRSERFRFAKGKTVFVRATWVGPKEWQDEGGRQIYRILEEQISTTTTNNKQGGK